MGHSILKHTFNCHIDLMNNNIIAKGIILATLILSFASLKAQNTRWFECKYFNQGTDIQYLHNPYLRMEASQSKSRLLISSDINGITVYNSNGPSYFYKHNFIKYKLENGKNIELHEGINEERQYYQIGITAPIGTKRTLYDSSIIIATKTKANLYGTVLMFENNLSEQTKDSKLSISIDSFFLVNQSIESEKYSSAKRILIIDGKKFSIDEDQFDIQIMRGTESVRHYVIKNNGTELFVKKTGNKFIISISFVDGGIIRLYATRI